VDIEIICGLAYETRSGREETPATDTLTSKLEDAPGGTRHRKICVVSLGLIQRGEIISLNPVTKLTLNELAFSIGGKPEAKISIPRGASIPIPLVGSTDKYFDNKLELKFIVDSCV
jgi:hypothetical protein